MDWTEDQKTYVLNRMASYQWTFDMYLKSLPEVVKLALTTGKDENDAFYTRSNDVIIMCEKYWEGTVHITLMRCSISCPSSIKAPLWSPMMSLAIRRLDLSSFQRTSLNYTIRIPLCTTMQSNWRLKGRNPGGSCSQSSTDQNMKEEGCLNI